jgi:hypothetical protein
VANRFRNILPFVVPRWLSTGDGEAVLYTLGMMKDAATERLRQGLEARFPTRAAALGLSTALALAGEMRGIPRGRDETDSHYAARLKAWRFPRGHRVRGNAFALLEQVSEYFGGVRCWTIDTKGTYRERDVDGTQSAENLGAAAWDWDTLAASYWGRFWIGIDPTSVAPALMGETPDFGDPDLYGGELYDDAYSIGQTGVTPYDVEAIRGLFRGTHPWHPQGTRPEWVIIQLDGTDQTPDDTWEHWSADNGTHKIPSRYSGWRYWSMRPAINNTYAGDPSTFYTQMRRVDGTLYSPSSASYTDTYTMPDGSTYVATPNASIESIRLVDDGGIPV